MRALRLAAEARALSARKALGKRFGRMVKKIIGKEIKQGVRRDREKKEEIVLVAVGTGNTEPRFLPQRRSLI